MISDFTFQSKSTVPDFFKCTVDWIPDNAKHVKLIDFR